MCFAMILCVFWVFCLRNQNGTFNSLIILLTQCLSIVKWENRASISINRIRRKQEFEDLHGLHIYNYAHKINSFIIKELQSLILGFDYTNKDLCLKIQSTHYFSLTSLNPLLNPLSSFSLHFPPFYKSDITLIMSKKSIPIFNKSNSKFSNS